MEPPFFHVFMLDDLFPSATPSSNQQQQQQEQMSSLWRQLPTELLESVVLWLPAASQARCQAVCKSLLRRLSSPEFKERSAALAFASGRYICGFVRSDALENEGGEPYSTSEGGLVTDLDLKYKVHRLKLDFLPQHLRHYLQDSDYCSRSFQGTQCLLMMVITESSYERSALRPWEFPELRIALRTCVVNPCNNTWKEVPVLRLDYSTLPRMSVEADEENAGCFKVFVVDTRDEEAALEKRLTGEEEIGMLLWVYSSFTDCWTTTTRDAELAASPPFTRARTYNTHAVKGETFVIPTSLRDTFEVWGLHSSRQNWELLSSMPQDLVARIRGPYSAQDDENAEDEPERCLTTYGTQLAGDAIFFTVRCSSVAWQVVAYHIVERLWQIVLCDFPKEENDSEGDDFPDPEHWLSWQRILSVIHDKLDCQRINFLQPSPGLVISGTTC